MLGLFKDLSICGMNLIWDANCPDVLILDII